MRTCRCCCMMNESFNAVLNEWHDLTKKLNSGLLSRTMDHKKHVILKDCLLPGAASTSQLDSTAACSVREHLLQYSVQCTSNAQESTHGDTLVVILRAWRQVEWFGIGWNGWSLGSYIIVTGKRLTRDWNIDTEPGIPSSTQSSIRLVIALVGFPSNAIVVVEIEQSMRVLLLPTSLHSSVWIVCLPSVSLQPYACG
jgi:hypothetical protein